MTEVKSGPLNRTQWAILAATAFALGILAIAAIITATWIPTLPETVAVHWGISSTPNGFATPGAFIIQMVVIMGAVVFLFAAVGFSGSKNQSMARLAVGGELYIAGLGALLLLSSLSLQRGVVNASEVRLPAWVLAVSLGVPLVIAVIGAWLVPGVPTPNASHGPAKDLPRAELIDGQIPTLRTKTSMSAFGVWAGVILIVVVTIWVCLATRTWYLLIVGAPLAILLPLLSVFTITIGTKGVQLRSLLGWPKVDIAAAQIAEAKPVEVSPLAQFGGWGYRMSIRGTIGIVLRKGPGVEVVYGDEQKLVFTTKDAEKIVPIINTIAEQNH